MHGRFIARWGLLGIALMWPGCGGTSSPDAGMDSGGPAPRDLAAPTILAQTQVLLPGHPHPIDVFGPADAQRAVIFLHGGGGTKEAVAAQLTIVPSGSSAPDSAWLISRSVAFVFPQGQAKPSAPKAMTWTNYVMDSGVDDLAFLAALQAALRGGTLVPALAKVSRVYLAGHSNGGMMANRAWCESSTLFDGFAGLAGPASVRLYTGGTGLSDPNLGAAPCRPTQPKPYLGLVGAADAVLQTTGNWAQQYWSISPALAATPSFVDPNLVNEEFFHRRIRVPIYCSGTVANPTLSGDAKRTSWSDCGGRIRLVRAETADHCLAPTSICSSSLPEHSGLSMRDLLVDFFTSTEVP